MKREFGFDGQRRQRICQKQLRMCQFRRVAGVVAISRSQLSIWTICQSRRLNWRLLMSAQLTEHERRLFSKHCCTSKLICTRSSPVAARQPARNHEPTSAASTNTTGSKEESKGYTSIFMDCSLVFFRCCALSGRHGCRNAPVDDSAFASRTLIAPSGPVNQHSFSEPSAA